MTTDELMAALKAADAAYVTQSEARVTAAEAEQDYQDACRAYQTAHDTATAALREWLKETAPAMQGVIR
ncbi:MAG TPA: hypothetical protein VFL82_03445 [Thermomicrobiales bacterium]|nr:hypothetical protein [Thermomicrobiales bacterium]